VVRGAAPGPALPSHRSELRELLERTVVPRVAIVQDIRTRGTLIDQGVAVRVGNHVYLADANGKPLPKKSPSVEGVAKLLGHGDDTDFGEFLIRQVYGGEGNPFRHGTARDGVRDRTICLAVAVLGGWLDAFVTPGALDLLREAVVDELERREEGQPEESPGE
jgi:hypothetical protein